MASETGHVYTFATPKLQPLITKPEGKNLIQACLNAPDGSDYGHHAAGYGEDEADDRQVLLLCNIKKLINLMQIASSNASSSMASLSSNYAAAMAGLAGYPYPQQGMQNSASNAAVAQAYAHYPAYAAQYNAALAAGYWPQGNSPQSHDRAGSGNNGGENTNEGQN